MPRGHAILGWTEVWPVPGKTDKREGDRSGHKKNFAFIVRVPGHIQLNEEWERGRGVKDGDGKLTNFILISARGGSPSPTMTPPPPNSKYYQPLRSNMTSSQASSRRAGIQGWSNKHRLPASQAKGSRAGDQ